MERAQEILYVLRHMYDRGELPKCKVFLDSPLAISATKIFLQYPEYFNEATKKMVQEGKNPFIFPYVHFTTTVEESKSINAVDSGAIILAGEWHVLHRRKDKTSSKAQSLEGLESSVIFVGYQTEGTLGRAIIDGAKTVKIYGEEIAVKAKIYTINGFSSHADKPVLLQWLKNFKDKETVYIIHE
ncbi:MAG: MBL fold metallo-hydrolase RNA specificity domain-containing protein [Persephonella sp.]|nr:MBL fold metallo-hydrolase RNA specificity domain-containing protein [Persephonella sp.]